jgi:hypothetical protein
MTDTAAVTAETTRRLPVARLYTPIGNDGRRPAYDQDEINRLMQPEHRAELDMPIRVYRRPEPRGSTRKLAWAIIDGKERVEAARALGLTEIEAIVETAPAADTHPTSARTTAWASGDTAASLGPAGAPEPAADAPARSS